MSALGRSGGRAGWVRSSRSRRPVPSACGGTGGRGIRAAGSGGGAGPRSRASAQAAASAAAGLGLPAQGGAGAAAARQRRGRIMPGQPGRAEPAAQQPPAAAPPRAAPCRQREAGQPAGPGTGRLRRCGSPTSFQVGSADHVALEGPEVGDLGHGLGRRRPIGRRAPVVRFTWSETKRTVMSAMLPRSSAPSIAISWMDRTSVRWVSPAASRAVIAARSRHRCRRTAGCAASRGRRRRRRRRSCGRRPRRRPGRRSGRSRIHAADPRQRLAHRAARVGQPRACAAAGGGRAACSATRLGRARRRAGRSRRARLAGGRSKPVRRPSTLRRRSTRKAATMANRIRSIGKPPVMGNSFDRLT